MKKHNKGKRKDNLNSKSSLDEKTAKPPHPTHKPQSSIVLKWGAACVVALLIAALFVMPSIRGKNNTTSTGNKYADATTTLQNHIKGKLPDDWFKPMDPSSLIPRTYLYADVKNKAIVLVDEGKQDSIFYSKRSNNGDNIFADSKSKHNMDQLRALLNIDNFSNLDSLCSLINADQTYLSRIKKSSSHDDQLLSLIYNTIVGDTAGHLYIAIEKNKLKAIRYDSLSSYRLNIDKLVAATRAVHYNPERYNGLTLKEVFEQHDVVEVAQIPPFACLDYRNDCIRVTDGTVVSGEAYFRWRDTLIDNPSQLYLFKDNKLMVASVENINTDKVSYGTIDKIALDRTVALQFDFNQLIPYFLLIFGLIEGVLIYSLLFGRKRNIPTQLSQEESSGVINNEEINKIKELINNNTTMRSDELNILVGQLNILISESYEYGIKRPDIEKANNLTTLLSSDFTIEQLLNSIVQWWNDIDGVDNRMERAKLDYEHYLKVDYLNTYKRSKEYNDIKEKSDCYDLLFRCDKESHLLELLDRMRAKSNGKMAEINTFTTLKEKNPTLKEIVQMYDNQTKSNLIGKYEEMERKSQWYDKNSDSVVQPVEKARKSIATSIDRKKFVRTVFEDILLPMFGKDNKNKITEFLNGYLTTEDEARVYHLMMGTRSEFNLDGLKKELSDVVDKEDAEWLANMREIARRYSSINKFNETMWVNFVKEFVEKERTIDSDSEKGWFFSKVLEIAYHTADYIRSIKEPADFTRCHNAKLMANGLDMKKGTKEFDADNPMKNTGHAKKIFEWADELGVKHLKIVVDNYAIMP